VNALYSANRMFLQLDDRCRRLRPARSWVEETRIRQLTGCGAYANPSSSWVGLVWPVNGEVAAPVSNSMGEAMLASVGRPVSPRLSEVPLGRRDDGSAEEEAALARGLPRLLGSNGGRPPRAQVLRGGPPCVQLLEVTSVAPSVEVTGSSAQ